MTGTYTAEVRWEDGQWQANVRELPGAHTYAKTMSALRKRLREVIVLMDDRPDEDLHDQDAFTVSLSVSMTASEQVGVSAGGVRTSAVAGQVRPEAALQMAADARQRAADAEEEAEHATAIAVLMAQEAGISMRDAAALLGISHQRVQQISGERPPKPVAP